MSFQDCRECAWTVCFMSEMAFISAQTHTTLMLTHICETGRVKGRKKCTVQNEHLDPTSPGHSLMSTLWHCDVLSMDLIWFQTGPFILQSPPLSTYNQQLWLTCIMQVEHSTGEIYSLINDGIFPSKTFMSYGYLLVFVAFVSIQWWTSCSTLRSMWSWRESCRMPASCTSAATCTRNPECCTVALWVAINISVYTFINQLTSLSANWLVSHQSVINQPIGQWTRHLSCCFLLQKCDEIIVVHLGYLNYTQYQINVSFKGLENITYEVKVNFMVSSQHTGWKTCLNCQLAVSEDASHPTDTQWLWTAFQWHFFLLSLSGRCIIPRSLKWRSGSGLSLWFWPSWWR